MSATTPRRTAPGAAAELAAADRELRDAMTGYQAGDARSFELAYARLAPVLKRYLLAIVRDPARADDLVQETFLQLHRARHTYDPAYPVLPWALAIARHVYLMDRRHRARRHEHAREELDDSVLPTVAAHDEALATRSGLRRALGALGSTTREALVLHHVCGLTFHEISERLKVSSPALRCRTSRGLARMREMLRDS